MKEHFHAEGKGLHEYLNCLTLKDKIDERIIQKMRYIATIRNKLIHDHSYQKLDDRTKYVECYQTSRAALLQAVKERKEKNGDNNNNCIIS